MASNRMMRREDKRIYLQRHREKREALKQKLSDPSLSIEEKYQVLSEMEKLPRDSSYVRLSHRCKLTGRARGVYRKFGVCRNMLRELAMRGEVPGLVKSSW
ncbi:30S ribosomal protein S14 [Candidatus Berkiella cookevillensis]|uniref:Small ribosomal subunit protein uS14 n=1 Tax=Candidatus Berkiella cookevillensis TaxID=437022 RepID=A0A0Q9YR70_9GAMM|nr:30S ribosomal protein S14 [Candidatus Berkiella cookevillensis]MCS5709381.1 30S ribosomal protein S14 [Candidatus Berkiella cookevillensis]